MNMKQMLLSGVVALALAPAAMAGDTPQDKAIDKHGQPIWDARGNCVRTKWQTPTDTCGAPVAAPAHLTLSKEARTVYFDFNKSTIKASEKAKLDSLIRAIKESKEVNDVDIVGHADKIGNTGYNDKLSRRRAEAVKSYLWSNGVKTRKIDLRALGEGQPVTRCDDSLPRAELIACLAADRRVEIELNLTQ